MMKLNILECFQKFIDEDMWQLFAEQTNVYANQFLTANPNLKPRSRARSWMDTNLTEMRTLTGFSFFMVMYRNLRKECISLKNKVL